MDKKGKSIIILGLIAMLALVTFVVVSIAHSNPQGKHPQGFDTESCQDALAGADEQLADRGTINPHLLDNIDDKCGVGEPCITREECGVKGGSVLPIHKELCESELACGIAATFECICPI